MIANKDRTRSKVEIQSDIIALNRAKSERGKQGEMNNDLNQWKDESVRVTTKSDCSTSCTFGNLIPLFHEKPDVLEAADWRQHDSASEFLSSYELNHYNLGYGDFKVDD